MTQQQHESWCECGEYRTEQGHPLCPSCKATPRNTAAPINYRLTVTWS